MTRLHIWNARMRRTRAVSRHGSTLGAAIAWGYIAHQSRVTETVKKVAFLGEGKARNLGLQNCSPNLHAEGVLPIWYVHRR